MSKFKVGERVWVGRRQEWGEVTKINPDLNIKYRVVLDSGVTTWASPEELEMTPDEIVVNGVKYVRAAEETAPYFYTAGQMVAVKARVQRHVSKVFGDGYNVDFPEVPWGEQFFTAWIPAAAVVGLWEDK